MNLNDTSITSGRSDTWHRDQGKVNWPGEYFRLSWRLVLWCSPGSNLLPQWDLLPGFALGLYLWQKPRYCLAHSSKVLPSSKKPGCHWVVHHLLIAHKCHSYGQPVLLTRFLIPGAGVPGRKSSSWISSTEFSLTSETHLLGRLHCLQLLVLRTTRLGQAFRISRTWLPHSNKLLLYPRQLLLTRHTQLVQPTHQMQCRSPLLR